MLPFCDTAWISADSLAPGGGLHIKMTGVLIGNFEKNSFRPNTLRSTKPAFLSLKVQQAPPSFFIWESPCAVYRLTVFLSLTEEKALTLTTWYSAEYSSSP